MKTLLRIVAIVAVSLVVIGGAYAYVQNGGGAFLGGGPGFGERGTRPEGFLEGGTRPQRGQDGQGESFAPPEGQNFENFNGSVPGGFGDDEGFRRGGREGGSLFSLGEIIKNVVVMGVITLVVIAISVTWRSISRRMRRPAAAAPPASS